MLKARAVSEVARSGLRMFQPWRDEDQSGVSGTGRVAVGAVFPSGKVVMEWLGARSTFGIYQNLQDVEHIHGHGGRTHLAFDENCATKPAPARRISHLW